MITSVRLQNYRSYSDESFEFDPGINIVVGPNASGKTNLLESVLVLATGNSYRARDIDLIKFDRPWSRLDGVFKYHTRSLKIEKVGETLAKSYIIDDKEYKRINLDKTVPVVYFEPNHLQLITRGPEQRRDYFDGLIERSLPGFKSTLLSYRRALAQRNALLKRGPNYGHQQLFAWDIRLSELGQKIAVARQNLTDDINTGFTKTYSSISKKKSATEVVYQCQFPTDHYSSRMLKKLQKVSQDDYLRGFTSAGPHREDFLIMLNNQPAGLSASRGENRSLMLTLKIFELELIGKARSELPIFLLDDVFSELDGARRQALVSYLKKHQAIITTTDADSVIAHFTQGHNLIALNR